MGESVVQTGGGRRAHREGDPAAKGPAEAPRSDRPTNDWVGGRTRASGKEKRHRVLGVPSRREPDT